MTDTKCSNKNYETALAWVQKTYPFFFQGGVKIELVSMEEIKGAYGIFDPIGNSIRIANCNVEPWDFVDTIVHELTHSMQFELEENIESREVSERQADGLGFEAAARFKREHGIAIWR